MCTHRLALLAVAVVVAAGCGEDKPAKAEFIQKADSACKKREPPESRTPQNRKQAQEVTEEQLEYRRQALADFEEAADPPPDGLEKDLDAYKAKSREVIDIFERQLTAAKQNKEREFGELGQQLDKVFRDRQQIANRIGLKVCGQPTAAATRRE